jgi:hypothetical protein
MKPMTDTAGRDFMNNHDTNSGVFVRKFSACATSIQLVHNAMQPMK